MLSFPMNCNAKDRHYPSIFAFFLQNKIAVVLMNNSLRFTQVRSSLLNQFLKILIFQSSTDERADDTHG